MGTRKWILWTSAAIMVGFSWQSANGQNGRPDSQTLAAMGLGGMTIMSDDDAMAIRGHGYKGGSSVAVFGNSFATYNTPNGSAHSENGYAAEGKHKASGKNFSQAGVEYTKSGGKGGGKPGGKYGKGGAYGKPGGGYGGGKPGGGYGGGTIVKSVRVFAGGYSSAKAF